MRPGITNGMQEVNGVQPAARASETPGAAEVEQAKPELRTPDPVPEPRGGRLGRWVASWLARNQPVDAPDDGVVRGNQHFPISRTRIARVRASENPEPKIATLLHKLAVDRSNFVRSNDVTRVTR